jgi:hypothetical protein
MRTEWNSAELINRHEIVEVRPGLINASLARGEKPAS